MRTKTKHKINCIAPRLSDEDPDPIEQDDSDIVSMPSSDGWLMWDPEDIMDVRNIIATRLPPKQQFILEAFLDGLTYHDVCVTEKYWRYHFAKGVEIIKKELKV